MRKLVIPLLLVTAGLAFAGGSVIPEVTATHDRPAGSHRLWSGLDDAERAEATVQLLLDRGDSGTEVLLDAAEDAKSLTVRGWAIMGLAQVDDPEVESTLWRMARDHGEEGLVRSWAGAALLQHELDMEEVTALSGLGIQGIEDLIVARISAASSKMDAMELCALIQQRPQLTQTIAPLLTRAPVEEMVEVMYTGDSDPIRRTAASYLAARPDESGAIASAVVEALAFEKGAEAPWQGGALYIPSIPWPGKQARALISNLESWKTEMSARGRNNEVNQIQNNLNSVGLRGAAGR